MKQIFAILIITILLTQTSYSQDLTPVIADNGKYGFINENNDTVIKCIYDYAEDFDNGLALIKGNLQYKLIDTSGVLREMEEVSNTGNIRYDLGEGHSGLPLIVGIWKCSFIDVNGEVKLDVPYQDAYSFSNGKAKVIDGDNYNYINKNGILLGSWQEITDNYRPIKYNEKYGYIDKNGKLALSYEYDQAKDFKNGYAQIGNEQFWAIIDLEGRKISSWYEKIGEFNGEIAIVEHLGNIGFINKKGDFVGKWYSIIEPLEYGLYKVSKYEKYAIVNKSGELVTQWYDKIYDFNNGFLKVEKEGKFAYLNEIGGLIIGWYDNVGKMENNTILVKNNEKYAYYNTKHQTTSEWFDTLSTYSDGVAVAMQDDEYGFIDKQGNVIIGFYYDFALNFNNGLAVVEKNGKVAYIDKKGNIPMGWNERVIFFNSEPPRGLIAVKIGRKYGFQTLNGKRVIPARYDYAENFSEGLALVKTNPTENLIDLEGNLKSLESYPTDSLTTRLNWGNTHDGKPIVVKSWDCEFINFDRMIVIDLKEYDDAYSFSNGKAKVVKGDKYNYINHKGELIGDWTELPQDYHAAVKNGKFGFINNNNETVIDYKFNYARDFENGVAKVRIGSRRKGKYFLINEKGEEISEHFDKIFDFKSEITKVENVEKYALINISGKKISDWYDNIEDFYNKNALVKKGEKVGYINNKGELISSEWYDEGGNYSDKRAKVKKDEKWGYLNGDGKLTIKPEFDKAWNFNNNVAKVRKESKYNFIDKNGNEVSNWYDRMYSFADDMAIVCLDNKWGYININGDLIIACQYDRAYAFSNGKATVIKDGETITIGKDGNQIKEEE